jgi:hypothetical protein
VLLDAALKIGAIGRVLGRVGAGRGGGGRCGGGLHRRRQAPRRGPARSYFRIPLPDELQVVAIYPIAVTNGHNRAGGEAFVGFVQSPPAQAILERRGAFFQIRQSVGP